MPRIRKLLLAFFVVIVVLVGFAVYLQGKHVVPIIMYHHVSSSTAPEMNTVSTPSFRKQMAFLKERGYNVISFDALVTAVKNGQPITRKSVVITFDDGYLNNYTDAFAVLKEFGFPAMVFMVADKVGTPGYMTWEQLKEISQSGFAVGSHTRTHAYLPDAKGEALVDEVAGSKRILEEGLGQPVDYFSYPSGGFSEEVKRVVQEAGYKGACSTNRGHSRLNQDVFELKRIRFNDDESAFSLWAKLSGYYNSFRKSKNPY